MRENRANDHRPDPVSTYLLQDVDTGRLRHCRSRRPGGRSCAACPEKPELILLTHGPIDHIGAVAQLAPGHRAPVLLGQG